MPAAMHELPADSRRSRPAVREARNLLLNYGQRLKPQQRDRRTPWFVSLRDSGWGIRGLNPPRVAVLKGFSRSCPGAPTPENTSRARHTTSSALLRDVLWLLPESQGFCGCPVGKSAPDPAAAAAAPPPPPPRATTRDLGTSAEVHLVAAV
ncbi:unnamed protein product [Lampetra planeri]